MSHRQRHPVQQRRCVVERPGNHGSAARFSRGGGGDHHLNVLLRQPPRELEADRWVTTDAAQAGRKDEKAAISRWTSGYVKSGTSTWNVYRKLDIPSFSGLQGQTAWIEKSQREPMLFPHTC